LESQTIPRRKSILAPMGERRDDVYGFNFQTALDPHCEPTGRANARPMTGSAKQSIVAAERKDGLLRRFAPRNDVET
jgi:hypothetical protein